MTFFGAEPKLLNDARLVMVFPRTEITLELTPQARVDIINVSERITEQFGDILSRFQKAFYYSYHTTAGYFDQSFCRRLNIVAIPSTLLCSLSRSCFHPKPTISMINSIYAAS